MLSSQQIEILKNVLGEYDLKKRGTELYFYCPYCEHYRKKFAINIESGKFHCWKCEKSGHSVEKLVWRFGDAANRQKWEGLSGGSLDFDLWEEFFGKEEEKEKEVFLPEEYISLIGNLNSQEPRKYLSSRGITEKDICFYKIGYCKEGEYANRIIFPSFDKDGKLNTFVARAYNRKPWPVYTMPEIKKKKIIFNELYLDYTKPIVLVEGVFDAIKAGNNSVPLLGSYLREDYAIFKKLLKEKVPFVYSALDPDAEEKEKNNNLLLKRHGIEVKKIDISGYKDPGDMTKMSFIEKKEKSFIIDDVYYLERAIKGV